MDPIELAGKYLGEYKIRENEINVKKCPFCKPQKKDNYWKFFLNKNEGIYYCHRQNNCGVKGSFQDLLKHFGQIDMEIEVENKEISDKIYKYFKARGIDNDIISSHNIKTGKNGNIAFEYYYQDSLVLVKYRNFQKGKEKKYWQEGGGRNVLWEIDNTNPELPLLITEGEIDKLALHQAGLCNIVSVPFGSSNFKWVDECWEELEEFDEIVICPDNDNAGEKFADECVRRLGEWRCRVAEIEKYSDINEVLHFEGAGEIRQLIENAEEVGMDCWLDLSEIEEFDLSDVPFVKSSIPLINKYMRGYRAGELTIWTGVNGSGKSTFILQEALESVEEEGKVALITGEMQPGITRYILELQAAGTDNIEAEFDSVRDELKYYTPKEIKGRIREWAEGEMKIYKNFEGLEVDKIRNKMTGAVRRYGCFSFVVDNLMKVNYKCSYQEKWNKQSQFVDWCKDFAQRYGVHVHVVAHPRKPKGDVVTKEDVAGLYEVTNIADNVICVHRTNKSKILKALKIEKKETKGALEIWKNRMLGKEDKIIPLMFDESCRRFWQYGQENNKEYGWE